MVNDSYLTLNRFILKLNAMGTFVPCKLLKVLAWLTMYDVILVL